jgi:predicted RecA/RadA family phage recombinase
MKNYLQLGDNITLPAPYDVVSGAGALIGSIFGVASTTEVSGADCSFVRVGVFTLPKATGEAWSGTAPPKIYWDNTNKRCTTSSSGNTLIGAGVAAAQSADTSGNVLLTGQVS